VKVFVTGVKGQLGYEVVREMQNRGHECIASDLAPEMDMEKEGLAGASYIPLDITDEAAVVKILTEVEPDIVIHCAAWTAVDLAEEDKNKKTVRAVNALGTRYLAEVAKKIDASMIYISTDYVFSGNGDRPWEADCTDYHPLNYYGETKLEGEKAVLDNLDRYYIVRIAWVFGPHGKNFVRTMLDLGKKHVDLSVVDDQIGTPTYTADLAVLLADMAESDRYGIYHATNEGGYISWYDFACEIFRQSGMDVRIKPVSTSEYGLSKAARPFNSRLDRSKLVDNGFKLLPDWKDALGRYLLATGEI